MTKNNEELLYSYEKLCELLAHPDNKIVCWSLRHLNRLYYPCFPENIFDVFHRNHSLAAHLAAKLIADRGNQTSHGPRLRQLLAELPLNDTFAEVADVCRQFKDVEAQAIASRRVDNPENSASANALTAEMQLTCECAPKLAVQRFLQYSWADLTAEQGEWYLLKYGLPVLPPSLLHEAVDACRNASTPGWHFSTNHLSLIGDMLDCQYFVQQLEQDWKSTEWLCEEIRYFLGQREPVSQDFMESLASMHSKSVESLPAFIFESFEKLGMEKKWDIAAWCTRLNIDETLTPFQKWIAQVHIVLDELRNPSEKSKDEEIANLEAALAVAAYLRATVARDDQSDMERTDDRTGFFKELVTATRPQLFLDFETECLSLETDILVPALADALSDLDEAKEYRILRTVRLIPRLEKLHPGVCAPLAQALVDIIDADLTDFTNEEASDALKFLGGAAVDAVLPVAIPGKGDGTEIYLQSVLAAWPCQRIVDAHVEAALSLDEVVVENMEKIGAPEFVPLLLPDADVRGRANALKLIDEIHALSHPDREKWEKTIADAEAARQAFWESGAFDAPPKPLKTNKDKKKKRKQQKKSRKKNRKK
jgi:hypothetical protein